MCAFSPTAPAPLFAFTLAQRGELAAHFSGELLWPDSADYDERRRLWNGVIDKRPAAILRPRSVGDVQRAVGFAAEHRLPLSVRGGGHNVAGEALCEGVVIDLGLMRAVEVDARRRVARVQGGATWAEVDAATQCHGLAAPGGMVSETGVAGLTLGGGLGWLRRKLGLSCDQVRAFEVVTRLGQHLRADAATHPDLYWALRGGGQGLGVVTTFEFDLFPVGPDVMFLMTFYPAAQGLEVLRAYRELCSAASNDISALAVCGRVPAGEPFAPETAGEPFVLLAAMYAADAQAGLSALQPWRELAQSLAIRPLADLSGILPYVQVQRTFDADYPAGRRYYWKSAYLRGLPDEALALALKWARQSPSPLSTVDLWQLGGAIDAARPGETAYAQRGFPALLAVEANWEEQGAAAYEQNLAWARGCVQAFAPFAAGGAYLNFPGFADDPDTPLHAESAHSAQLRAVKLKYNGVHS